MIPLCSPSPSPLILLTSFLYRSFPLDQNLKTPRSSSLPVPNLNCIEDDLRLLKANIAGINKSTCIDAVAKAGRIFLQRGLPPLSHNRGVVLQDGALMSVGCEALDDELTRDGFFGGGVQAAGMEGVEGEGSSAALDAKAGTGVEIGEGA